MTVDFKEKEFVGIIGPNGSGKSTFLKCLYRVLQPETGRVVVNGQDIRNYPYKESAQKTAVVAQQSSGNLDFSVKEFVLMGCSILFPRQNSCWWYNRINESKLQQKSSAVWQAVCRQRVVPPGWGAIVDNGVLCA